MSAPSTNPRLLSVSRIQRNEAIVGYQKIESLPCSKSNDFPGSLHSDAIVRMKSSIHSSGVFGSGNDRISSRLLLFSKSRDSPSRIHAGVFLVSKYRTQNHWTFRRKLGDSDSLIRARYEATTIPHCSQSAQSPPFPEITSVFLALIAHTGQSAKSFIGSRASQSIKN